MHVALTWSVQLANATWSKVEIGVDENDLARIFHAAGGGDKDPWADPGWQPQVSTTLAYSLLAAECERLMLAHQITHFPESMDTPENRDRLRVLTHRIKDLLGKVKERP